MKKVLPIVLIGTFLAACLPKSTGSKTSGGSDLGFNDLEPVMFHLGRMESSHLFTPETVTLDKLGSPLADGVETAAFMQVMAPIFKDSLASELVGAQNIAQLLPALTESVRLSLKASVSQINNKLSGTRYVINLGFLPFRKPRARFADNGMAHSGLRNQESGVALADGFLKNITDSMQHIQTTAYNQKQFKAYLLGAILQVSLVKDRSYATLQLAVGFNPQRIPYEVQAPELTIREIVVPDQKDGKKQTVMLLDFKMNLATNSLSTLSASFGQLKGVEEVSSSDLRIQLKEPSGAYVGGSIGNKIYTGLLGLVDFNRSSDAEPYLSTTLNPSKLGASTTKADKIVAADFRFRKLDVDLQNSNIRHAAMGVSVGADYKNTRFTTGFFSTADVDKQFREQINANLAAAMGSAKSSMNSLITKLMEGK